MLVVRRPLEAAHFLPVALQPALGGGRGPDVPLEDHTVPAARRQLLAIPRQGTLGTRGVGGVRERFLCFTAAAEGPYTAATRVGLWRRRLD